MLNLINNAIAYRDPSRGAEIQISYEKKLEENIFHVKDNGCGIDPSIGVKNPFVPPIGMIGVQHLDRSSTKMTDIDGAVGSDRWDRTV